MRKRKHENLVGKKFSRLLVIKEAPRKNNLICWECLCNCGKIVITAGSYLKSKKVQSCGCLSDEKKRVLKNDLTGKTYGSLKILERDTSRKGVYWRCLCVCGKEISVESGSLIKGRQISCGCVGEENRIKACTKHGKSVTVNGKRTCKLYSVWDGMKQRCYNENHSSYKWYGKLGIRVCEDWKNDFKTFYNWAMNSGYAEGLQIDRIDSNDSYYPENCRWVTPFEQAHNKKCFDLRDDSVLCIPKIWKNKVKACKCGNFPKMRVGLDLNKKRYGKALCLVCNRKINIEDSDLTQHLMWKKLIEEWNSIGEITNG